MIDESNIETMKLTWVNHASFILEGYGVKMICDPWIDGRVFNRSWALLAPSVFSFDDYKDITHIWFSHEHPDHFFPPNIKSIPPIFRKNITVLFQNTIDKRVIRFCENMGFKSLIELEPGINFQLTQEIELRIGKVVNDTDSWMFLRTPDFTLLNLNDCILSETELSTLTKDLGKIDVLLSQFSFANWAGNKNDAEHIINCAKEKKEELLKYVDSIKPKHFIPFASFVWFCSPDNFHFNQFANRIDEVDELVRHKPFQTIVMYPGDVWIIGQLHDSSNAIDKYAEKYKAISSNECSKFESCTIKELEKIADEFVKRSLLKNNKNKLFSYDPFTAYLYDLKIGCSISYKTKLLIRKDITADNADIFFHSQNLKICLENEYGFDTILIAGTFQKPRKGNFQNFMEYEWVANLNNQGKRMDGLFKRSLRRLFGV